MPFIILLLVDTYSASQFIFKFLSALGLSVLLSFALFINWEVYGATFKDFLTTNFATTEIRNRMSYSSLSGDGKTRDIALLSKMINLREEKFTVLDDKLVLDTKYPFNVWSAIHGPVNFKFISQSNRKEYLRAAARTFNNNSGWVIYTLSDENSQWLEDYNAVFTRVELMCLEYACAIKYVPREDN